MRKDIARKATNEERESIVKETQEFLESHRGKK